MFGRRRRKAEIFANVARRGFPAPHRFRDQRIGQNQPRIGNVFHRQHDRRVLVVADIVARNANAAAFDAVELAAKALAPVMGNRHFDLHKVAGVTLKIRTAYQRPIDAG